MNKLFCAVFSIIFPVLAWGAELDVSGFVGFETRLFAEDPQFAGQHDGINASILVEPEFIWGLDNGDEVVAKPFVRVDSVDDKRTHADIRELYWLRTGDDYEILVGFNKVFWGKTETRHLVDIINQTDFLENVDGEAKLGQPMLQLATLKNWGTLRLFIMPVFREREDIGLKGRLRNEKLVDKSQTTYSSAAKQYNIDTAIRYEHVLGNWDIGVSHFYGNSREPVLSPSGDVFVPHYNVVNQTGLDIQYTGDDILWKLESIVRSGQGETFFAATAGLEYILYGVANTNIDVGILAEYHRDDRGTKAPATNLDDDVFLGARFTLNNIDDTQFLGGVVVDRFTKNRSYFIEASQRINNNWKAELEARVFSGTATSMANVFSNDSFLQLRLNRFF